MVCISGWASESSSKSLRMRPVLPMRLCEMSVVSAWFVQLDIRDCSSVSRSQNSSFDSYALIMNGLSIDADVYIILQI